MDNIVWEKPDGSVAVTHVIISDVDLNKHAAELKERGSVPADWEVKATNARMPVDKTFRAAWAWTTKKSVIDIDIGKAKDILHSKRRVKREAELAPLDKEITINIVDQAKVAEIESSRKIIRDKHNKIQSDIDACTTETGLRAVLKQAEI